jgi:hypothetical protein
MPMPVKPTMFNDVKGIMPSPWRFQNYGQCGMPVSELFPHMGACADDLCLIRSMTSTANEHAQGNYVIHTGQPFMGFPNAGAWINYGLGSENRNLPGFVVLASGGIPLGGIGMYGSGFLSAEHQASVLYPEAEEALHKRQAEGVGPGTASEAGFCRCNGQEIYVFVYRVRSRCLGKPVREWQRLTL